MIKVKVIGGAGAFSDDNSSFLVTLKSKDEEIKFLFDCGENAFRYLRDTGEDIDFVYISHTHQDHIGGLEKLIFFNYFVKGKETKIIAREDTGIKKFLPEQKRYVNGEQVGVPLYDLDTRCEFIRFKDFLLATYKVNHIAVPTYGIQIVDEEDKIIMYITGDTKATYKIADNIKSILNNREEGEQIVVFHDYQTFGSSINSIHCCKDDFEVIYGDIKDDVQWYLYHNDEFNEKYKGKELIFKGVK